MEALTVNGPTIASVEQHIDQRAEELRGQYQRALWAQTDRMFAGLLVIQWAAAVATAVWLSPWAWRGLDRHVNPHVWAAVFLGGLIAALPVSLAIWRPGEMTTRMVIAVAQMLHSALLIHLSGGRIETHFHVFGSLAFLSFYRDWRVLVPATIVVAADHAWRGIFLPESVFGVVGASHWRWTEHAGWVVFEDVILVWSCLRGARELAAQAARQAELESSNKRVEAEVARQTQRLEVLNQELVSTARRAGMADIATGVLHNVGNVLNSVNVAASVIGKTIRQSELASLLKATELLKANESNLSTYLSSDERGRHLPPFLIEVGECLSKEHTEVIAELATMETGLDHIKEIVSAQQQHAKHGVFRQKVTPSELFEQAIAMDQSSGSYEGIQIVREFAAVPAVALDKHKVLQILINLLSNARKSVLSSEAADKQIGVRIETVPASGQTPGSMSKVRFFVTDNGVGIAPEHVTRIFNHGFTTRGDDGHGFGLHSAANAAREMGGDLSAQSDGPGRGAVFTVELPLEALTSAEKLIAGRKAA
jgi:signal transduction histidine kinase